MTVLEMHTAVQLGLDKSSSLQLAAFEPEEIDFWLNEAQIEIVKRKAFGNNYRQEDLFGSIKRMEDLTTLLKDTSITSTTAHPIIPNVVIADISTGNTITTNPYMFYVDSIISFTSGASTKKFNPVLIDRSQASKLYQTEYNNPFIKNPFVYLQDSKLYIIKDPYLGAVSSVTLTYLKHPKKLVRGTPGALETNTSELPVQMHPEIVALTVVLLLENIEAERRLQTNSIMFNNKE